MKSTMNPLAAPVLASLLAFALGCGGKSEDERADQAKPTDETPPVEASLPTDAVPFGSTIERAGFEIVYYNNFPASAAGRKGRMVLYQAAAGGRGGGAVFVEQSGTSAFWVWHWYFEDTQLVSFERLDVNGDGLWDVRFHAEDGDEMELIHDKSFVLLGAGRKDRIALNGSCSEPDPEHPLWHCFDGNPRTTWRSRMDAGGPAYIEVASPFGLSDGILSIRAGEECQPRECVVYADGHDVQGFELGSTGDEQLVQLDPAVRTAKEIRLVFKTVHGGCGSVAVAELQIR